MPHLEYSISLGQVIAALLFVGGAYANYSLLRASVAAQKERLDALEQRLESKLDRYEELFRDIYEKLPKQD